MNPANKQILDAHEHFYTKYLRVQTITGMSTTVKNDLLRVMREEFWPGYTFDMWCSHCVGKFLVDVYKRYEEWKAVNIVPVPPEEKKVIKIKATFPKNKLQ